LCSRAPLSIAFPLLNFPQDVTADVARKKKRSVKPNNRSLVSASLEVRRREPTKPKMTKTATKWGEAT
jgi:hypothetical protein